MKCDIVGTEDNYKYLVVLYTHHFSEPFTFFFFTLQVCFWAIYDKKLKFSFILATSCEYDNVEVKEKSVIIIIIIIIII